MHFINDSRSLRLMRARDLVLISMCGALYASVGILTYLGIFAPVFGVVRFWPGVFVPGVFAVAFGPIVGGLGAAVGIFISDMMSHGDALLSLTVGVPSNLLGFYVLGYIAARRDITESRLKALSAVAWVLSSLSFGYFYFGLMGQALDLVGALLLGAVSAVMALPLAWGLFKRDDATLRFCLASAVGLALGSVYIGVGIWAYSYLFALPLTVMAGQSSLPVFAAILLSFWTYCTEIPFLVVLVPPIYEAVKRAIPSVGGSSR
jgi:uncharacterized membrane protein